MTIRSKINDKFNESLRSKDKALISTLRLILAAVKDRDIANRTVDKKDPVGDLEIIKILKKMLKQRKESAELYKKAGRQELVDSENKEMEIITIFLPKQMGDDETKKICMDTVKILGASSIKDIGKIMSALKKKYPEGMDFSKVNKIVKELLNSSHEVS